MPADPCLEMQLLLQAEIDGEVSAAEASRVQAHLQTCPACAALQERLVTLSRRLRQEVPRHTASPALQARILATAQPVVRPARPHGLSFAAGFALAACLAVAALLPGRDGLPDAVVAAHIRALQPGHLMDVVSTDQHTVKPWFDGRLPFAPPVKELAPVGYPLAGGRMDYLPGHMVATLIYHRRQHVIDLFTWPDTGMIDTTSAGARDGYNFIRWHADGMSFWAVSDLNAAELGDFVKDWRAR